MLFGPDAIVACPHCGTLARHWTLESGNTFGASQWTDGKTFAPMLQRPPEFVRCRWCRGFYWLDQAKAVGELPEPFHMADDEDGGPPSVPPAWTAAPRVEEPTEIEYLEAIDAGLVGADRVLDARILAWWRGNDPFRGREYAKRFGAGKDEAPAAPEARRRNLEALLGLLDDADPGALVMKAEALRHLGRFDDALAALGRIDDEGFAEIVATLRGYCEIGDSDLYELGAGALGGASDDLDDDSDQFIIEYD